MFKIMDDGTETFGDVEYDDDSRVNCPSCPWEGKWGERDGKLFSYSNQPQLHGQELVTCTEEEWREDNGAFADVFDIYKPEIGPAAGT